MASRRRAIAATVLGSTLLVSSLAVPAAVLATDIAVNTLADTLNPGDGKCSLREAIDAANLNIANTNPDCADGTGGEVDRILFSVSGTITLTFNLPAITGATDISGSTGITIDGGDAFVPFTVTSGDLTLRDLTIQNGFGVFGGTITNGGTVILVDSTIRSSQASYGAGIHNNGAMAIFSSTIEGNSASAAGGGIYNEGELTIRNATLTGNTAPEGAGIYNTGTATIDHATIARNTASAGGGGGVNRAAGTVSIYNSIVVGNTGFQTVGSPYRSYSVVQTSADGVIDTALRDNGGPTRTIRLPAGSKALSIADPDWCDFAGYVDQRGLARPSGTFDTCDAGAVQRDRTAPTMTSSPKVALRDFIGLSGTSLRARLQQWTATDGSGIGLERFSLQRQVNGGAWTTVSTSIPVLSELTVASDTGIHNVTLTKDKRHRFRIRAVDEDSNVSAWAYSPTVTARLYQQTSSRFVFSSGWTTASSTKYSGGSLKYTRTDGKSFRVTFKGRAFALVTTLRPSVPVSASVYVDGSFQGLATYEKATLMLRAQAFTWAFPSSSTRTVRFVIDGTNRFDVDAVAVLE